MAEVSLDVLSRPTLRFASVQVQLELSPHPRSCRIYRICLVFRTSTLIPQLVPISVRERNQFARFDLVQKYQVCCNERTWGRKGSKRLIGSAQVKVWVPANRCYLVHNLSMHPGG